MSFTLYFDGCSKGNPGRAGAGYVLYNGTTKVKERAIFVGEKETNNVAEYTGLLVGLLESLQYTNELVVKGDSELVIKQMRGEYKTKHPRMIELNEKVKKIEAEYEYVSYIHVERKYNKEADLLSNQGLYVN
jgi:ribonuclease HI